MGKHIDEKRPSPYAPFMRRAPFLALFILSLSFLSGQAGGPGYGDYLRDLSAMSPRMENSAAERDFFSYVEKNARRMGYQLEYLDLTQSRDSHSFSRVLVCRLPGTREDCLVIAVAANDSPLPAGQTPSSVAPALALHLMQSMINLPASARSPSFEFAFLGAELPLAANSPQMEYPLGSKRLIMSFPESRPTALIYLNPRDLGPGLKVNNYAPALVSPFWIFDRVSKNLSRAGFTVKNSGDLNIFYRASLIKESCVATAFLRESIPAIELASTRQIPGPDGEKVSLSSWEAFFTGFLADSSAGFQDTWDRHYYILNTEKGPSVLREGLFIILILTVLLCVCLVFMIATLFARKTMTALGTGFYKTIFSLPLYFSLSLGSLYGSSLLLRAVSLARGSSEFIMGAPIAFSIARGLLIVGIFVLFCLFLVRLKLLPVTISFYGVSAALLFFLDIFIFSAFDLSFSLFFAWSSIACIISMLFRNRIVAIISMLATILPLAILLRFGATGSHADFLNLFLKPDFFQSLSLAFIVLPVILLFIRLLLLFYRPEQAPGKRFYIGFGSAAGILACSGLLVMLFYPPYSKANPIPLRLEVLREGGRSEAWLYSPALIKEGFIQWAGQRFEIAGRPPQRLSSFSATSSPQLTASKLEFLNRKSVRLILDAQESPYEIRCFLESDTEMRIYDSSLPFSLENGGRRARIFIGAQPRLPLDLELTLPQEFKADILLEFLYPITEVTHSEGLRFISGQRLDKARFSIP